MDQLQPVLPAQQLLACQQQAAQVKASDAVLNYVQRLIEATRTDGQFVHGISPRGGMALVQCARAWAFLEGRDYVTPDDVQAVLAPVFGHRLVFRQSGAQASLDLVRDWASGIPVLS